MSGVTPTSEAERWLRFARDDLVVAESVAAYGQLAPHIGCYHAQQSAEKPLKTIFTYLQMRYPLRLDLDELRDAHPPGWQVVNDHPDLSDLTQWAVDGRYSGNWPEATAAEAQDAARQARAVWESVLSDLDGHGFDVSVFR